MHKTITGYSGKKGADPIIFKINKEKELFEHKEVDAAPSISEIDQEIRLKEEMRAQGRIDEYRNMMGHSGAESSQGSDSKNLIQGEESEESEGSSGTEETTRNTAGILTLPKSLQNKRKISIQAIDLLGPLFSNF
jgi:hypothetical protein